MRNWPTYLAVAAGACVVFLLRGSGGPAPGDDARQSEPDRLPLSLPSETVFWTTPGLEPDTCIAAWLLTRVVSPGARIVLAETSQQGTPFDVPGRELAREPGRSVSDAVVRRYAIQDEFARALAAVARELELNPWTMNDEPFFSRVRAGLADALNASPSDEECLRQASKLLDDFRVAALRPSAPAPMRSGDGGP